MFELFASTCVGVSHSFTCVSWMKMLAIWKFPRSQ